MQDSAPHVVDIIDIIEQLAPPALAEAWDNCGLQVGSEQWPVRKIWVALDPLLTVIEAAITQKVDILVTHHPLLLTPLTQIDLQTDVGRVLSAAIKGQIAIFSAHTNLDSTIDGINDVLAHKVGLHKVLPLVPACSTLVGADKEENGPGIGRIGTLSAPVSVDALAHKIKKRLGLKQVKVAGDAAQIVQKVAVCSGSGAGLVAPFLESDAQVYVSGDLKYHQARDVEAAGRALIDVGHFASECIIIDVLVRKLQDAMIAAHWPVTVEACTLEQDPFRQL